MAIAMTNQVDEVTDGYIERHSQWALAHLDPRSWRHDRPPRSPRCVRIGSTSDENSC